MRKPAKPIVNIVIEEGCERGCPNIGRCGDDTYCSVTGTNFGEGAPFPFKMYPFQKECPYLKEVRDEEIKKFCKELREGKDGE